MNSATNRWQSAESLSPVGDAGLSRRNWLARVMVANVMAWIAIAVIVRLVFF